ncbi:Cilia- and flagella-associated protein 299 [Acropora cervicornis]|uniref:Cilia- and flagella-associated protein 299 n=1 Tax=Acropora cervicornis TaxID=6130 RepID=A0AAD9UWS6_ACRCE|nr:Cilia- and flagella-associated protein 299 [Acropora cervicornis]
MKRRTEDFEPYFNGRKRLLPRPSDLSFYNWETQSATSNPTPNYQVIAENPSGLLFKNKRDRKILNVDPKALTPGDNSARIAVETSKYTQVVIYDHITRRNLFTLARYKRYPWLSYDFETKKACCYPSQKYLNAHDFTFDNWKKPERLTKHHKSERHQTAMAKWIDGRANKRNTSVLSKLQESHTQDVKENRDYLELSMNVSCLRRSRTSCSGATMNNVMV